MASDGNTTTGNGNILLKWTMPRAFFIWPDHAHVTTRSVFDIKIQDAMRTHGGTGFRFRRRNVVDLLVEAFEALTMGLICNDASLTDEHIIMASVISVAQAHTAWLDALSVEVVMDLVFAIAWARKSYVLTTTEEKSSRDNDRLAGTNAQRLALAVDDFLDALSMLARQHNWEGEDPAQHMATIAGAMSLVDNGLGLDHLPPLPTLPPTPNPAVQPTTAPRRSRSPPTADEQGRMDNSWAIAAREKAEDTNPQWVDSDDDMGEEEEEEEEEDEEEEDEDEDEDEAEDYDDNDDEMDMD